MNLKQVDNVNVYEDIRLDTIDGVIDFKNFWAKEFQYGQELFFYFHRLEDLTDQKELDEIEKDLLQIFNEDNIYIIIYLDKSWFTYLFKYEYKFGTENLLLKFWRYFYGMDIIIPNINVSFKEVCEYFYLHRENDIYLRSFKANGYAKTVYIKGLGGDYLIKNK
ncbi:hypothetical protein ACFRAE_15325 [Sphingobacterium sp. HJSM2_6]|uniref:hypothetical protein n=1 Tax=Sphingobacterium sp. HJSM2_6 TaxID=3366264 RepID=UPI003BEA3F0E